MFDALLKEFDSYIEEVHKTHAKITAADRLPKYQELLRGRYKWTGYYKLPFPAHFALALGGAEFADILFRFLNLPETLTDSFRQRSSKNSDLDKRGKRFQTRVTVNAFMSLWLRSRFRMLFHYEIKDALNKALIDIEAFFDVVRIDPSALAYPTMSSRLSQAILEQDKAFLKRLGNVLIEWNPYSEYDQTRLKFIVYLLYRVNALRLLDPDSAFELFAVRMSPPLYTHKARKDPAASLWRNIERWKKNWATGNPEELS